MQHSLNVSEFQTAQLDLLAEGLPPVEKDDCAIDVKYIKAFHLVVAIAPKEKSSASSQHKSKSDRSK
jgi:hypothetical protein